MSFDDYLDQIKKGKTENVINIGDARPNLPWAKEILKGKKSAPSPSPLLCWHLEESRKRDEGLENEIDINEIKAAFRGVKNKWFNRVKENPEKFKPILENRKVDWNLIISK